MINHIKALQHMINYMIIHLPEKWQTEKWFKDGRNAVKSISKDYVQKKSKKINK